MRVLCFCVKYFVTVNVSGVSDFIQFEIWDIPGQFKLSDIDAVATFSCTGTLIFIIDSQVTSFFCCIQTYFPHSHITFCAILPCYVICFL